MVRPTEEEKDLQKLNSLQDSQFRPEFTQQMKTLRQRVFKRVKPKMLNQMNITGDSLLQLAIAYTEAINTGGVPCIESAWTSVCKSECKKAAQDALQLYKGKLKECLDSKGELDDMNRLYLKDLETEFRKSSVGEDVEPFL
jgi:hypothetical protein